MSSTAADAVEHKTISVLVAWHLDGLKAWIKSHVPTWMSQRIDPDFNEEDDRDREVMRILRQLIARPSGSNNYYEGGNGDKRLLTWILGVLSLLLVGAVGGGVSMYGKLTAIERGLYDHNGRIESLERINERRYRGADGAP